MNYFQSIWQGTASTITGFRITVNHLLQARKSRKRQNVSEPNYFDEDSGIVTVQYPDFHVPVPDNGRYTLHCEIDDCIVCDKCAKVCPVDCIAIEAIKSPEVIGKTADGTAKRLYAAQFDIDMAKCCFCGLCTTVCPTECLTMTDVYDYSTYERDAMNFQFATMNVAEMALRRNELTAAQEAKAKAVAATASPSDKEPVAGATKPPAKPFKPFKPSPSPSKE